MPVRRGPHQAGAHRRRRCSRDARVHVAEQLRAEPLGARTDVFSLGCVIYEMISGGGPFSRDSTAATIAAVLGEQPRPFPPSVPAELQRIVGSVSKRIRRAATPAGGDLLVDLRTLIRDAAPAPRRRASPGRPRALYIASIGGALALLAGTASIILRPPPAREERFGFWRSFRLSPMPPRRTTWATAFLRASSTACRSSRS